MAPWLETAITIFISVIACTGFWNYLNERRIRFEEKKNRTDPQSKMLMGLGHDRIVYLCMHYIDKGWVSNDEYEDLKKYLYKPYVALGGNGTAERLMREVDRLPIHHITYIQQAQTVAQNNAVSTGSAEDTQDGKTE